MKNASQSSIGSYARRTDGRQQRVEADRVCAQFALRFCARILPASEAEFLKRSCSCWRGNGLPDACRPFPGCRRRPFSIQPRQESHWPCRDHSCSRSGRRFTLSPVVTAPRPWAIGDQNVFGHIADVYIFQIRIHGNTWPRVVLFDKFFLIRRIGQRLPDRRIGAYAFLTVKADIALGCAQIVARFHIIEGPKPAR